MSTAVTLLEQNALITAFMIVALLLAASNWIAARIFQGQIHGSAIAITLGLLLAYWGGWSSGVAVTGGKRFFHIISMPFPRANKRQCSSDITHLVMQE